MILRCDDISVRYRIDDGSGIEALSHVSLAISQGDRVSIVGPNGSGKSTLALCLAGLIRPTSGSLRIGDDPDREPPFGAIVFQAPDDDLIGETVREEILLTLEHVLDVTDIQEAAMLSLGRFGLEGLADRPVNTLSGGEKQKVALACALLSRRPLIVLDEPTSHLDPPGKRDLRSCLETLSDSVEAGVQPALVLVTQYEEEARVFPRVIELSAGRIVYDGPSTSWIPSHEQRSEARAILSRFAADAPVILSCRDLGQIDAPGWRHPSHPLAGINLEVCAGEAIGLCGPIGAGKTTLGYHLAGLMERWGGELEWPAHPGNRSRPVVVIQFPERQLFCQTVMEEVALGPKMLGLDFGEATARSHDALDRVGLPYEQFGQRWPFSLSGGQQRRAALAIAAALRAPLYILDEPQAALDAEGFSRLRSLCQEWLDSGSSYIMISHDLDLLRRMTGRVWVMNEGRIEFDGSWDGLDRNRAVLSRIGFDEPKPGVTA